MSEEASVVAYITANIDEGRTFSGKAGNDLGGCFFEDSIYSYVIVNGVPDDNVHLVTQLTGRLKSCSPVATAVFSKSRFPKNQRESMAGKPKKSIT